MGYELVFEKSVKKDFANIGARDSKIIMKMLLDFIEKFDKDYEQTLLQTQKIKILKGNFQGLYRLKLRSFRVIYQKQEETLRILVIRIAHRREVYKDF